MVANQVQGPRWRTQWHFACLSVMPQRWWKKIPSAWPAVCTCIWLNSIKYYSVQRQILGLLEGWLHRKRATWSNLKLRVPYVKWKTLPLPNSRNQLLVSFCWIVYDRSVLKSESGVVLQIFLTTPKPVLKFAATRTLAALALTHPTSVATCNIDLETLITDPNCIVATYAITTLLKVRSLKEERFLY